MHPANMQVPMRKSFSHCRARKRYQPSTKPEAMSSSGVSGRNSVPRPAANPANAASHSAFTRKSNLNSSTEKIEPRNRNSSRHSNKSAKAVKNVAQVSVRITAT